jgi:hypothetical protein
MKKIKYITITDFIPVLLKQAFTMGKLSLYMDYQLISPGAAQVFIYPNLIVICVPSLTEIAHIDSIFSIITSTLLGGTLPSLTDLHTVTSSH